MRSRDMAQRAHDAIVEQWHRQVSKIAWTQTSLLPAPDACRRPRACRTWRTATWWWRPLWERLDAKQALVRELEAVLRPEAALASNTSSLSVTAIAVALHNPRRMAGLHFSTRYR